MGKKKLSQVLHEVDPGLKIIEGSVRRKTATSNDWILAGGALCSQCGLEAVRFCRGVCIKCAQDLNEKLDRDEKKRARQIKFVKQHNARINKKKKSASGSCG